MQLMKDIVYTFILYGLYNSPLTLIVLIDVIQLAFTATCFAYKPYNIEWMNHSLLITQSLYIVLNSLFTVLIAGNRSMSERTRYYLVGFSMIATCVLIIACNIGFSMYSTVKDIRRGCRLRRDKKNKLKKVQ